MSEQIFAHWDVILSIGLIIMSFARSDAEHKSTKIRVDKLEEKVEKQDDGLAEVKQVVAEIKGLTKAIYDQVMGKN